MLGATARMDGLVGGTQYTSNGSIGSLTAGAITSPKFTYCPNCGTKREPSWQYCPMDGRNLSDVSLFNASPFVTGLQQPFGPSTK